MTILESIGWILFWVFAVTLTHYAEPGYRYRVYFFRVYLLQLLFRR